MSGRTLGVCSLVWLITVGASFAAAPPQHVLVTVVNKHLNPTVPVSGVRVSVSYFDGSQQITDDRERTNRQGQIDLAISAEAVQRGDLRLTISGAEDLVIYQPAEGLLNAVPAKLTIELLRKGSPALLEPIQIEAMLDRLSRLTIQNRQLTAAVQKAENQEPDFDEALREWARQNGLPYDQVNARVQIWASDLLANQKEESLQKRAEAELALRHYNRAAILFRELADNDDADLNRERNAFLAQQLEKLRAVMKSRSQEAKMDQLDHHFAAATQAMNKARDRAASEHLANPTSVPFRDMWLLCSLLSEFSHWQEGQDALTKDNTKAVEVFTNVLADSKVTLSQIDPATNAEQWSYEQSIITVSALLLSETSTNEQAHQLRIQALAASRAAVVAVDRQKDPDIWARLEEFYGLMIGAVAVRGVTDGHLSMSQAGELLTQSTDTLKAALAMYSPQKQPEEWCQLEEIISGMLAVHAIIPDVAIAEDLLNQAETAARAPLAILNPKDQGGAWADAEGSLGYVLAQRAERSSGVRAESYYDEAAAAMRASIAARSKNEKSAKVADTENQLATLLQSQAMKSTAPQAISLLKQSVDALNLEATLIPREGFPQRWAKTQNNLGESLSLLAVRLQGAEANQSLTNAAAAFRNVLAVFTRQDYPARWATATFLLANVLATQGEQSTGKESFDLLGQAAAAYTGAIEVLAKDYSSSGTLAQAERSLSQINAFQGMHSSGETAHGFFLQSAAALENLAKVQPSDAENLSLLSALYHDHLMDFPKSLDFATRAAAAAPNPSRQLDLAEAELTTSRFSACIDTAVAVDPAQLSAKERPGRLTLLLACQWGAGQHSPAARTAEKLTASVSGAVEFLWNSEGDSFYLTTASEFGEDREAWLALFQSLQAGDEKALVKAANDIRQRAAK